MLRPEPLMEKLDINGRRAQARAEQEQQQRDGGAATKGTISQMTSTRLMSRMKRNDRVGFIVRTNGGISHTSNCSF